MTRLFEVTVPGKDRTECQDAICSNPSLGRIAIADGVSSLPVAPFRVSQILVDAFAGQRSVAGSDVLKSADSFEKWIQQVSWSDQIAGHLAARRPALLKDQWEKGNKKAACTFACLETVKQPTGAWLMNLAVVGDCSVFHIPQNGAQPIEYTQGSRARLPDQTPAAVVFGSPKESPRIEGEKPEVKCDLPIQEGDLIVLATDHIAGWIRRRLNRDQHKELDELIHVRVRSEFETWLDNVKAREDCANRELYSPDGRSLGDDLAVILWQVSDLKSEQTPVVNEGIPPAITHPPESAPGRAGEESPPTLPVQNAITTAPPSLVGEPVLPLFVPKIHNKRRSRWVVAGVVTVVAVAILAASIAMRADASERERKLRIEIAKLERHGEEQAQTIRTLSRELDSADKLRKELQKKYERATNTLVATRAENDKLQGDLAKIQREVNAVNKQLQMAEKNRTESEVQRNADRKLSEKEMADLKSSLNAEKEQNKLQKEVNLQLRAERNELRAKAETAEGKLAALKREEKQEASLAARGTHPTASNNRESVVSSATVPPLGPPTSPQPNSSQPGTIVFKQCQFTAQEQDGNAYSGFVPQMSLDSKWLQEFRDLLTDDLRFRRGTVRFTVFMHRKKFQMWEFVDKDIEPDKVTFQESQPNGVTIRKGQVFVEVQADY